MPQNNDPLGILGSSTPEQAADPLGILSQTPPEKKSPIGTPSQGGLQGSQATLPSPSTDRKIPTMPLAGLGGVGPTPAQTFADTVIQESLNPSKQQGTYVLDGKKISKEQANQFIHEKSFVEAWKQNPQKLQIYNDYALQQIGNRQIKSLDNPDWMDSLAAGAADALKMGAGAAEYMNDFLSDITKVPNLLYGVMGAASGAEGLAQGLRGDTKERVQGAMQKFAEDAEYLRNQRFQVEGDFIDQVGKAWETGKVEDIGNAVSTAINTAAESAVPSLLIGLGTAATGGGTGLLALARGGAVVTPLFIGGEYEQQKTQMKDIRERLNESQKFLSTSETPTSDEIALINLSKAGQYIRPAVKGTAEAAGEMLSFGIWKGSAKLAAESLGSLVRKTATTVGKEAAEEVARTGSKELTKRMFESMAIDPLKEGFSELGTFAAQELTDVLLGVSTKSPDRILREGLNAWALGAASGGVMSTPGAAGTGIMLTGRGLTNAKKYLDNIIAFDSQGLNELNEVVRTMEERGQVQQAESIKENISKREKAVKAVPKEKVADTETVDTVEEIQALEESKKGLLPVYQEPIQEEINAKVEKLKSDVKKEYPAPTVNTTPTESNYASVNRNDGKGTIDLTQEEYLAEMERRGTPVEEIATEGKTEEPSIVVSEDKVKEEPLTMDSEKTGLVLYHGSPHSFKNFDITKLGSGEGAQAFGHGLYFTNESDIAKGYANKLGSKKNFWEALQNGHELSLSKDDYDFIKNELDALGFDGSKAENADLNTILVDGISENSPEVLDAMSVLFAKDAKKELEGYDLDESQINRLLEIKKKISDPQFYKVTIHEGKSPSEYDYIEWRDRVSDSQREKIGQDLAENITGEEAYKVLSKKLGSDKKASDYLLSKGIDGISYKSEKGTGGKTGEGRNYVVFDPKSIRVDEINNQKHVNKVETEVVSESELNKDVVSEMTANQVEKELSSYSKNEIEGVLKKVGKTLNKKRAKINTEEKSAITSGGKQIKFKTTEEIDEELGERFIKIRAIDNNGKPISYARFIKRDDKKIEGLEVETIPSERFNGVASAIYSYADALGYDLKKSPLQTSEGRALWDSLERKPTSLKEISEAYHKAKNDGLNDDLVKEIDKLLLPENSKGASVVEATAEPIVSEQVLPDFKSVPTESVTTDEARFQGRESLDESRVQQIVDEFDERKLDPVIVWKDPETGSSTVLSGHHRFEAIKRMGKENIPVREFVGTEQEAIDFARDSNVLGKQESPVERAARYRQLREGGLSEAELQRRARSAHGKEATFMLNLSRLEPKGKAMDAIRQFDESTDKSTRSRIEAVADWIGALKKVHPDVSRAQETEMFDYLMEVYSPKSGKGKISTRNQFVDVASAVIDKMKERGTFKEGAVLNLGNIAGKGSLELEYDAKLEEAKQNELDARKILDDKRKEFLLRNASQAQMDNGLSLYEKSLRDAIKIVAEIRGMKEQAIAGDKAQVGLFDEIAEPTTPTDEITERRIERDIEESRGRQAKATGDTGRGEAKPKTGISAETEVDADIERMEAEAEKKSAERKALADRIRALKSPKDNLMMMPDFGITKKLYDAALDLIADQVEKGTAIGKAVQSAVEFIEKELKGAPWNKKAFEESFQLFESVESEPKKQSPKRESAPKGTSEKRYATRTVNALSKLKGKEELEQAIRDLGLRQEIVSWKKVQPIAAEIVEDVFSDPKNVDAKANDFYNEVLGTTNKDYIDNPELSTLHALTFHMMLDRLSNEGLDALYTKYSSLFQSIGSGKGRFISAMQQDASPYALMNLKIRPIYEGMNEALNEISETGSTRFEEITKVKELLDELLTKDQLIEAYRKKVGILAQRLEEASVNQTLGETSVSKPSPKGKERVKAGRKLFFEGLKEARGQLSAGLPINEKMLNGVKEMIAGLIEEGMYEASRLKKAIMKDVNEQLKGQPDAIIDLAAAIDTYLQSKEFDESRKEAMKAAFIESLENRAKSLMGNKRATEKSAEQVLLDSLLQKMGQEIGKDAAKGSKAYEQRLKAALENLEFSDDVWKAAISNVKTWLERQDMDPVQKAETIARLEDSASLFMENPFAKSDLRKAIRDGEKEIGVAVQDVVKKHWTSQNKLLESLAEKLVSELGLNAETAKKYEQAVMEEAKEYMNEKRLAAIREALSLDKNGMRKERSEKVNKRVIDRMIEAINLGILDDNAFRGFFAEKYGIVNLTPKDIRMMKNLNDLINIHEGTDISRRYTKELADYVETLKPWTATRVMMAAQGMTIKGMLTGLSTIAVNIPIGSIYSFTAATLPAIISNPVAFSAFMSEYSKAGLSKTGLKTFWDVLVDGYSPQEDGLGSKYDERDVYGDPIDYMIQNADKKKLWKDVRESKSPKEAAKNFGVMFAKGYLQIYRLANFAKAFDVLLSTRGVEFDLFLKYWNEESKAAGHPLRGKFDPNVSKNFIDKVREKMVYDPETRKEIEESVDKQIVGMRSRGERVGISYRQTLIREAMIAKRSMEDYKKAKERVASYLLMEQPTGLLSYAYDPLTKRMAIKEDNNPVSAALKLGFNLTLGLFLRISITAAQRGMENIPIAGLALPGILYDRVPSNPLDPRSEKEWRTFLNEKYDREQMKRRLMTHASVAALAGIVAMNMFSLEDDEEEEEQEDGSFKIVKRTRIVENPDKIFDVTGFSGEFFKTEQFNEMNTPRKDYYFRMKVGDKWHNAVPLRLAPHFLFPVSVLGGMSDDLKFNPNKDRRKRELLIESADDFMLAWSEMSFATIPKTTKTLYFAFQKGGGEGLMKVGEIVVRPVRTAVYPNAYRDAYKETKFLIGAEEKLSQGMLAPLVNDFPFLEDYMGESTFDIFGYPKKVTSKLIKSAEDAPGAGMLVDSFLDYSAKNEERFESPAWQKKMKYFPNVEIPGYWPSGFDYETKVRAAQLYGELLRKQIEAIPESKLQASNIEETAKVIDIWMNGRIQYDGSRSGGGMHNKLTKEVRKEIGMDRLTAAQKEEFKLKTTVRNILDMPDNEQPQDINALLDKLAKATKERKTLEEELKPKKSNQ